LWIYCTRDISAFPNFDKAFFVFVFVFVFLGVGLLKLGLATVFGIGLVVGILTGLIAGILTGLVAGIVTDVFLVTYGRKSSFIIVILYNIYHSLLLFN
jgi:hypothetical protein